MSKFWNEHYEKFKKLYEECLIYGIYNKERKKKKWKRY